MFEKEIVIHKLLGQGEIINFDGDKLVVDFFDCGIKVIKAFVVFERNLLTLGSVEKDEKIKKIIDNERERQIKASVALERELPSYDNIENFERCESEDRERQIKASVALGDELSAFDILEKSDKRENDIDNESEINDGHKLLSILQQYGFEGFLHTTELQNFKSIVQRGKLLPRNELIKEHLDFVDSANVGAIENTYDFVKASCRFYYYFKTPTNYNANYKNPVIMVFSEQLIYDNKRIFVDKCAAKKGAKFVSVIKDGLSFMWDGIFERGYYTKSQYCARDSENNIGYFDGQVINRDEITGMRNAEFLIKGSVDIALIKKIYFKYQEDLLEAKEFCEQRLIEKFCLDKEKFD